MSSSGSTSVQTTGGGKTYAEIGDLQTGLRAQIAGAQSAGDPTVADLQKQLATATTTCETVFKRETLRGVLLTSYGFSVLGDKAAQAATVIYVGVLLLLALSIAGFVHALATPKNKAFAPPELGGVTTPGRRSRSEDPNRQDGTRHSRTVPETQTRRRHEGAPEAGCPGDHVGQSPALGHSSSGSPCKIVDHPENQVRACGHLDVDPAGLGVAGDVGERLAQHNKQLVAHVIGDRVDRAVEEDVRVDAQRRRRSGGHGKDLLAEPAVGPQRPLQPEDRGADGRAVVA
jgi:hypothetical protein